MSQIIPWIQERLGELRESNTQPVTRREYNLLVAMITLAVAIGIVALFK